MNVAQRLEYPREVCAIPFRRSTERWLKTDVQQLHSCTYSGLVTKLDYSQIALAKSYPGLPKWQTGIAFSFYILSLGLEIGSFIFVEALFIWVNPKFRVNTI